MDFNFQFEYPKTQRLNVFSKFRENAKKKFAEHLKVKAAGFTSSCGSPQYLVFLRNSHEDLMPAASQDFPPADRK